MQWTTDGEKWRAWLVDYSAQREKAIAWLGDRYLLAKPVNRRAGAASRDERSRGSMLQRRAAPESTSKT